MNNIFTIAELENMFEIGRQMECMIEAGHIHVEDSKEAFMYAMKLAVEFEKEFADTQDYYNDLYCFISEKILDEFGWE
jgi:hypothetical protein